MTIQSNRLEHAHAFSLSEVGTNDVADRDILSYSSQVDAQRDSGHYTYDPLDMTQASIRLIKLRSRPSLATSLFRSEDDIPDCTISTFEASTAPPYVALSYTWGDPTITKMITLNGKTFNVRQNLYDFLTTYGKTKSAQKVYLWIDQLSIDQSNTKERNHQVEMMASIYRNSDFVIAWLDRSSEKAARYLSRTRGYGVKGAVELLQNRYFSRLWIVQEQLLAPRLYFMCGDTWLDWHKIQRGVMAVSLSTFEQLPSAKWLFHDISNAISLFGPRKTRSNENKTPWADNLDLYGCTVRFAEQQCEDQRDKIYGLLGLIRSGEMDIVVNYDLPPRAVYVDALRHLIKWTHKCDLARILHDAKWLAEIMLGKGDSDNLTVFFNNMLTVGRLSIKDVGIDIRPIKHTDGSACVDRWWFEETQGGKRHEYLF